MVTDDAERPILCRKRDHYVPLLHCLCCKNYPCSILGPTEIEMLRNSKFVEKDVLGFETRRIKMYLFVKENGTVTQAYEGFNPDDPKFDLLSDVKEVYYVSKVFVKQMRLVLKDRAERDLIRTTRRGRKRKTE